MDTKIRTRKNKSIRNTLVTVLVIAFFSGIVIWYYSMLYNEKRENIIREGEMMAKEAAERLDQYLSTNIDSIKLSAYTLDGMIEEGRSDAEIQDFLVGQSTAIKNAVIENSTGLYGYINGRFFSGTNWVPPEGYVATERPWYTKPMERPGEITMLDPYVDVQSGNIMLALGKTLCDGESVISVDVSLDQVQKLVEDTVQYGYSDVEMILNEDGIVVAHSDPAENGKEYGREKDTMGAAIVERLMARQGEVFEFTFRGERYIAYVKFIQNGWYCISVKNATQVFASLNRILLTTIAVVIATVLIIGLIMTRSSRYFQMSASAMAASEAKSAFLSNMSHEIRTPINAVLGMNEMILRESRDTEILDYAENIRKAGQNLLGIVNDILDFSKIESGKIGIIPVEYETADIFNDLINAVQNRAEEKGLLLKSEIDSALPRRLYGDDARLKQIVGNILTNAVKYTEEGSVTLKIGFEKLPEEPDCILLNVKVSDTGIGIREEDLDKLFSQFERIEEERNRNIEGTGLGMAITKSLLEMMGAELEVESVYGEGSSFGFSLKQKVVDWEALGDSGALRREGARVREKYRESFKAPEARILVVDDNRMNLIVFCNLLKQTQMQVDTAESGEEGIRLSLKNRYDLIFLDHMMPRKDGVETLREIRENAQNPNRGVAVICLTANAISGAREKYLNAGFDDYLSKPVDPKQLEKMLIDLLPAEKRIPLDEQEDSDDPGSGIPEELAGLSTGGIDVRLGMLHSGGADAYRLLLRVFREYMDVNAEEIERYLEQDALKDYAIKVHALKSSAKIIGAMELAAKAQALEDAGKREDRPYIRGHHEGFMKAYLALKPLLQAIPEEEQSGAEKKEADDILMRRFRLEIREAAEDMDSDRLEEIFGDLKAYRIPAEQEQLFAKLRDASLMYDYEEICALLSEQS